ncbi:hypothetical protein AMTRI_Chr05g69970 [Amborella trichopoda]|uniref:GATA-type domain-containing protein n=1 Tax=Amborella trichopoda TaxID=13333 RepID=U5DEB9_AMBTC|nr:GATA transcription factor 21 [Amborella trichopoda]ERN19782.1 hypothetical protein AMTR_s00064p00107710 [Amborella trichopoda]|eukprot:XP_006858315.1 GATA transcription factor 21 [Amborella trichopoda]
MTPNYLRPHSFSSAQPHELSWRQQPNREEEEEDDQAGEKMVHPHEGHLNITVETQALHLHPHKQHQFHLLHSSKLQFQRKNCQKIEEEVEESYEYSRKVHGSSTQTSSMGFVRTCSDCYTTKTPLWRSGPQGPKSLCNACGIRQRKARRAMAAAMQKELDKEKRMDPNFTTTTAATYYKKRSKKITAQRHAPKKRLCFEEEEESDYDETLAQSSPTLPPRDRDVDLRKGSAFHRVLPQDEEEAAILLMALSCGLLHG